MDKRINDNGERKSFNVFIGGNMIMPLQEQSSGAAWNSLEVISTNCPDD